MADQTKRNTPGTGTSNVDNTQGQSNQQPGTKRQGAESTQMNKDDRSDERQPGTQRQGAERTQMGSGALGKSHGKDALENTERTTNSAGKRTEDRDLSEEETSRGTEKDDRDVSSDHTRKDDRR